MKRVDLVVAEDSVDRVLQALASFGDFELIDGKDEKATELGELSETITKELRRLNYLIKILEVEERTKPAISFKELEDDRVPVVPSDIKKILSSVAEEADKIEGPARIADKVAQLHERLAALKTELASLELLKKAGMKKETVGRGRFATITIGSIKTAEIESLRKELGVMVQLSVERIDKEESLVGLAYLNEDAQGVEKLLAAYDFKRAIPGNKSLEEVGSEISKVESEIAVREKELAGMRKKHGFNLLAMREIIENCGQIVKTISRLSRGRMTYHIRGWVPENRMPALRASLDKTTDYVIGESDPSKHEEAPIKLNNRSVFKSFETLTGMFGLPKYNEVDPTAIMTFTFPIFFGLMFGDLGQGAIILAVGLLLSRDKSGSGFKDLGTILAFCGLSAMFFGVMYGNVFGTEGTILPTVWINPSHDPMTFLLYAITIGVLQLSLGIILSAVNYALEGHYKHILVPAGKLIIFWAGVLLVLNFGADFAAWAASPLMSIIGLGVLTLFASAVVEIERFSPKKLVLSLIKGFFEVYESIMGLLSNTISYARIFALVLVHAGLSMAMYQIADMVGGALFGILQIIVLIMFTTLIILLEGVMVFLHTMRLHYYEWFNKFFSAAGKGFSPMRLSQDYTSYQKWCF